MKRLAANVGQDIESPSVRHSHDDGLDAEARGGVDDLLHRGDQDLATLKTEPLLRRPFLRQEVLESNGEKNKTVTLDFLLFKCR